jgi:hypothetical protein
MQGQVSSPWFSDDLECFSQFHARRFSAAQLRSAARLDKGFRARALHRQRPTSPVHGAISGRWKQDDFAMQIPLVRTNTMMFGQVIRKLIPRMPATGGHKRTGAAGQRFLRPGEMAALGDSVLGFVNNTHSAATHLFYDLVMGNGLADHGQRI